ncbi:MAG: Bacterial extracellular solute-binding protein, family 3 [Candidatus Uhrbacteria bacterium GW2011_GWC2_41_11]|uniref:Bacterial extracellular solute-binding protein, family 3 n=1 Tax=Candidatus Uhrbacteria bacterium GW2011_GWC2_41_11 TaxID=1618985 RepID=A0A0G0UD93_9BACT|nr:MAG: Bacterial extracellular solute-binding protein, family 3 [Candidatus Uhrbacteria bacterium GW2011_GWC2_41_11]
MYGSALGRFVMFVLFAMLFCVPLLAHGQTCPVGDGKPLKVGVSIFEPMVIKVADGAFSGFEIELFEKVAKELGCTFIYQEFKFSEMLQELEANRIDVALGGISITANRELGGVDFSQPFYDSGIAVMARKEINGSNFLETMIRLWHSPLPRHCSWLLIYIFLLSHFVWWMDKGHENINDNYLPGIFEAIFFVCTTITTVGYGDFTAKKWATRAATILVMFTGIGIAGIIFSDVAALTMSEAEQQYSIGSVKDLEGKTVATVAGTTSAYALRRYATTVQTVSDVAKAYDMLVNGQVDGVVFDLPPLKFHEVRQGAGRLVVLPDFLVKEKYGIAFPFGSPLRESVSGLILTFQEDGRYRYICRRYFDGQ